MKVAIINYGLGNLGSVRRAFEDLGANAVVADKPMTLFEANRIVLPGVGAFSEGMARLRDGGWIPILHRLVREERKPLLGICLGMQMLAEVGEEGSETAGLGFIPGRVRRLDTIGCTLRIPHVGWNDVHHACNEPLFEGIPQGSDFYFVHSYALCASEQRHVVGKVSYGVEVTAAVRDGNVVGTQFHPEKSSKPGRKLLQNFLRLVPC